jgi:hypothetical protein
MVTAFENKRPNLSPHQPGSGNGHLALRLHGRERERRHAIHIHGRVQAVGGLLGEIVQSGNRVVEREGHQGGRPLLLDGHLEA